MHCRFLKLDILCLLLKRSKRKQLSPEFEHLITTNHESKIDEIIKAV